MAVLVCHAQLSQCQFERWCATGRAAAMDGSDEPIKILEAMLAYSDNEALGAAIIIDPAIQFDEN